MKQRYTIWTAIALTILIAFPPMASAQRVELHPYIGGSFPSQYLVADLRNSRTFGIKVGVFANPNLEIEGHFGRVSRLELKGAREEIRGVLWEAVGSYNFEPPQLQEQFVPFVSFGIGGLTARVDGPDDVVFAVVTRSVLVPDGPAMTVSGPVFVDTGTTFFNVSYSGGLKVLRLWGPLGLRGSIGGRTIPRFLGDSVSSLEVNGGVTVTWGD